MTRRLPKKDVAIVGLGWTGSIMALELSRAGLDVVAIERGPWRDTATDFNITTAPDELRYAIRKEMFLRPKQETLTMRNTLDQTALPIRQFGSTRLQTLLRVAIPLVAPGIASAAILVFIFSWNEFLFALTLTRVDAKTAAISILNYVAFEGTEWGRLAAAGVLILTPVLAFAVTIRKYLVQTTAGAVKG